MALNASFQCSSSRGERVLQAKDFFEFAYSTKLAHDEVLTAVEFPIPDSVAVGAYAKLERVSGDFAIVSVAAQLKTDRGGICREIGLGLGGVGVTPVKPAAVESFLSGKKLDGGVLDEACRLLEDVIDPLSDQRGSADYKRRVVKVLFKRTVTGLLSK